MTMKKVIGNTDTVIETTINERGLLKSTKMDSEIINYTYNTKDQLISKVDTYKQESDTITYNVHGQVATKTITKNAASVSLTNYYTDKKLTRIRETLPLTATTDTYINYDSDDRVIEIIQPNSNHVKYEYDYSGRVIKETINLEVEKLCNEYDYLRLEDNQTNLVKEHQIRVNNVLKDIVTYDYDSNMNIVSIVTDDNNETRYHYDLLNRLVREDNLRLNKSVQIKYDSSGNILYKKKYQYSLENKLSGDFEKDYYSYKCDGWKDQLISFNNEQIVYGVQGNPITYRNNQLEWTNKLELSKFGSNIYTYDMNGIRKSKKIHGSTEITINYLLDGTRILKERSDNKTLIYNYLLEKITGFVYNNNEYLYQRNIQGDITHILNGSQVVVGEYVYDSWGNHVVLNGEGEVDTLLSSVANINPFRYRGYYYDVETRLYYLNSRYYDPETGRFISADTLSILDESMLQINGLNLYMYCNNNPVMYIDPSGRAWWHWVVGGLIIVGLAVAVVVTAGAAGVGIGAAFAAGFTGGTLAGTSGVSLVAVTILSSGFAGSVMASGIGTFAGGFGFSDGKVTWDWNGASDGFMWGAITGAIGGAASEALSGIGEGLKHGGKFSVQAGINDGLSGGITALQGLITDSFSWLNVITSSGFGAVAGSFGAKKIIPVLETLSLVRA
ncbi:MAG: RHS repeat-associated core domain-containing protein [Acholeplasmatales bacterium]|jgi:RHS repeat-associated protein|nr:RHS repeat-associated core domain-containing protein [Acholeplasmatales bacterium]